VFAPAGHDSADYLQIALGREIEWRAAPIVNPDYHQCCCVGRIEPTVFETFAESSVAFG